MYKNPENEASVIGKLPGVARPVRVASCTLAQLLNCKTVALPEVELLGQLTIPEYQRPYIWKEKQIDKLLNDLIEYNSKDDNEKPLFYLGSILLHKDGEKLNIIDGQQRITTSLLIQKLKHPEMESCIKFTSGISISNIKKNLAYLISIQEKEIFDFREYDIIETIDYNKINVTLIITSTEDLAYTFFETQNTGGVRLEGSDIIKAHHLRAIPCKKQINYHARKWESIDNNEIEYVIQQLTKIRFWDNRKWRQFPFYRDPKGLKETLIDEYTIITSTSNEDISYYYSAVKKENGRSFQIHESPYKQVKQPLANGANTLDFVDEYVSLYKLLFKKNIDHRIDDDFYSFRNVVLHGNHGTLFLKELIEVSLIAYVSRFGFQRLLEASLWIYRAIYSLRVSYGRNVREDGVFKFVYDNQLIDNILEVFTPDELFLFLKKFKYSFNTSFADENSSKGKHINTLRKYFKGIKKIEDYTENPRVFDKDLVIAITEKIKKTGDDR